MSNTASAPIHLYGINDDVFHQNGDRHGLLYPHKVVDAPLEVLGLSEYGNPRGSSSLVLFRYFSRVVATAEGTFRGRPEFHLRDHSDARRSADGVGEAPVGNADLVHFVVPLRDGLPR